MEHVDCLVIGAGVIGLAVARELAMRGREVAVVEAADTFGTGISSRSSEVVHAGIYYPQGSLKATLCVSGRDLLYAFCERYGVPHRRCGKLIVRTGGHEPPTGTPRPRSGKEGDHSQSERWSEGQAAELDQIQAAAALNGVELTRLDRHAVRALEPALECESALFSAHTGIVDSHALMLALLAQAEAHGATIAYRSRVARMWPESTTVLVAVNDASKPVIRARCVVNCAGLDAPQVAAGTEDFPREHLPRCHFARGHYFRLVGRAPFRHLVYPIPEDGGLGVHFTLDLAGRARFGPDVEWVAVPGYDVDTGRAARFYEAIRRFWPDLRDGQLVPAYAGIRPKLCGPGAPPADFRIDGPATHGVAGLINLFGIESPGLTASLAIAGHVAHLVEDNA